MANIVTSCRILFSILMLFPPAFSAWFYTMYLFCGLTDMVDGTIARKTNTDSNLTLSFIELNYSAPVVCSVATIAAVQEGHFIRTGQEIV